jgi:hypothetical protein
MTACMVKTLASAAQSVHRARPAVRGSTGMLQDKLLKHRARPAARASTGMLQDKPLKHRARPAVRASTGWLQDKPLKHRAQPVRQTLILRQMEPQQVRHANRARCTQIHLLVVHP